MSYFLKVFCLLAVHAVVLVGVNAAAECSEAGGQALIEGGQYEEAIDEFTCVIAADPTAPGGYRGRIEAKILLDRYSDAVLDYQKVTALVIPVNPSAAKDIFAQYEATLSSDPTDVKALRGLSFARWWYFDYAQAIPVLKRLLELRPNDVYPNLFLGSSRLLAHKEKAKGVVDIEKALTLAPTNPHVRFIVADAYTYGGIPDPQRAFDEATLAFQWGLTTPRVHAILGASLNAFGDRLAAALHVAASIDLVTTDLVAGSPLTPGSRQMLDVVPGRVYALPIAASAGETISVSTSSKDMWDTIAVLLAPDGTPVLGADDNIAYFAAFDFVAPSDGVYLLKVTSFESVATGTIAVDRE